MRPIGEVCSRLAQRAAALAETRRGAWIVFGVALAVWWVQAIVIPLTQGRDFGTYIGAYVQLFQAHPIDIGYLLGRTPVAPLVMGALVQFAGGALAAPVASLLYAGSIVAWLLVSRRFGGKAALLTTVVLLAYPGYGILFHELGSDAIFAAAFAGWTLLLLRALESPTLARFALAGAGLGVLGLVRPGNQALLVLAVIPLFLHLAWRTRVAAALVFLIPAVVLLGGWALQNGLRYGDYTVARGGNATVPFYRAFVTDHIVRPSNGPASRELARVVQRDLLTKQPYRSYGITLHDFFTEGSARMQVDLIALSDRLKGFSTNEAWLRDVGVEAVRTHPTTYASGVSRTVWGLLTMSLYRNPPSASTSTTTGGSSGSSSSGPTVVIDGRTLPKPSKGEPIPAPHEGAVATRDGSIYTVWTSATQHHLVFGHPGQEARYLALHRRMDELDANLPDRRGHPGLAHRFNQLSHWFPPPALWLILGAVAFAIRRPRNALALWVPTVAALVVIVLSALGIPAEPHYSVPVAPAFVLLAAGGLFAPRREQATERASSRVRMPTVPDSLRMPAGVLVGAAAAGWAVWLYASRIHDAIRTGAAPHDLDVFLQAAGRVVHGTSPYAFHADATYAYPPLLAFFTTPLHPLGAGAATAIWTVLSLSAICLALWLLGVRDWRCYPIALVYPMTRSAVDLGTVGPLLLLAVAAAWRWRDRLVESAAAVGVAIALKVFLWPLAVWLAVTRRFRGAVCAAAFALALALVSWAGIGFAGIGHYPSLLHRLSDQEATSSYSIIALGVRGHLPRSVATVISVIVAIALLVWAARAARDSRRTTRDRDAVALTLSLGAALAASPIVWVHYFILLLVPLALMRSRLSLLWIVPFAYYPLGEHAWPAGDARKLAIGTVTTLVILVVTIRRPRGGPVPVTAGTTPVGVVEARQKPRTASAPASR